MGFFDDIWLCVKKFIFPFTPIDASSWGQLGDWIGGAVGTLITFASLIALIFTFWVSRAAMIRQSIYALFATMSKAHDDLVASFQMHDSKGSDVFKILLKDFDVCLRATIKHYQGLSLRQTVDVAYSLFFYGSTIAGRDYLEGMFDPIKIKSILDEVSDKRNRLARLYPKSKGHRLSGNQARLSSYYRNLYGVYSFIDESNLPVREKRNILKAMRTKMSNHEQALLALNICSHLGEKWEDERLLRRYEPIKNIPKAFLTLPDGSTIDRLFPEVKFDFERSNERKTMVLNFDFFGFLVLIKLKYRSREC